LCELEEELRYSFNQFMKQSLKLSEIALAKMKSLIELKMRKV